MIFARRVLNVAAVYGLLVLLPMYFLEAKTGHDYPPAITHPEYYYGFIGVAVAWQLAFLVMAKDPARYRALLIPAVAEKFLFGPLAIALVIRGRSPWPMVVAGGLDILLGSLFLLCWFRLREA